MIAYETITMRNIRSFSLELVTVLISTLIAVCTFPGLLLIVKAILVVNNGKELKRLGDAMTYSEGQFESFCQIGLQLYIIMVKPDRYPSSFQLIALSASILMLIKVQSYRYFSMSPCTADQKFLIVPAFIFKNAYILGTGAFIASVDYRIFFINVGIYYLVSLSFRQITKMCKSPTSPPSSDISDSNEGVCNTYVERSNICIGIFFIIVRLALVVYAMFQDRSYFYGNLSSIPLGIILIVIGAIYAILTYFANKRTSIESQKMILLYPIYL